MEIEDLSTFLLKVNCVPRMSSTSRLFSCPSENVHPTELRRSPLFRKLYITYFLNAVVGVALVTFFKAFGESYIQNDGFLSTVSSLQGLTFAVGAVLWGFAIDKFSYEVGN